MFRKGIILFLLISFFTYTICFSNDKQDKNIMQSEKLLKRAIEFHGHLGPYLVLGLKAGLHANKVLGKDPMKMKAIIRTHTSPPQSCFADGVQFSSGCTLGKGNISLIEADGLQVTFKKNDNELTLKLRKEIIEEIKSLPSLEEAWEKYAEDLYQREAENIFEVVK